MILKRILVRNEREEGGRLPSRYATMRMYLVCTFTLCITSSGGFREPINSYCWCLFYFRLVYPCDLCPGRHLVGRTHLGLSRVHIVRYSHGFLAVPLWSELWTFGRTFKAFAVFNIVQPPFLACVSQLVCHGVQYVFRGTSGVSVCWAYFSLHARYSTVE